MKKRFKEAKCLGREGTNFREIIMTQKKFLKIPTKRRYFKIGDRAVPIMYIYSPARDCKVIAKKKVTGRTIYLIRYMLEINNKWKTFKEFYYGDELVSFSEAHEIYCKAFPPDPLETLKRVCGKSNK